VQVYNTGGILTTPAPAPVFTLTLPATGTAVVLASATSVSLSWSANSNRVGTVFRLERSNNSVDYFTAYSGTSTAATVTSLTPETQYWFRVAGMNGDGVLSGYDQVVSTRTLSLGPDVPSSLQVSARSTGTLTWSWSDNANNETGYRVRRSSDDYDLSGTLPADTTQWLQTGLSVNTSQQVYIEVFNSAGTASTPDSSIYYTWANPPAGIALSEVWVSSVLISWSSNGNPESTAYRVERSTNNALFTQIYAGSMGPIYAQGLSASTSYWFRVRAENGDAILTAYTASVSTLTRPSAPTAASGLNASTRTTTSILWRWTDNAGNELGYRVLRKADGVNLSGDLSPDTTQWLQTGLGVNTSHQIIVENFNAGGTNDSSNSGVIYTLANMPSGLTVTGVYLSSASLAWDPNGNPVGTVYRIEKSTDNAQFSP
jgi:hypothetical protein